MLEPAPFTMRPFNERERKFYKRRYRILIAWRWRDIAKASTCLLLLNGGLGWGIWWTESWTLRILFSAIMLIINWFVISDLLIDVAYLRRFLKFRKLDRCQELHVQAQRFWEYGSGPQTTGLNAFAVNDGVYVIEGFLFSRYPVRPSTDFRLVVFPDRYARVIRKGVELQPEREVQEYLELPRDDQFAYHFLGSLEELHQQFAKQHEHLRKE